MSPLLLFYRAVPDEGGIGSLDEQNKILEKPFAEKKLPVTKKDPQNFLSFYLEDVMVGVVDGGFIKRQRKQMFDDDLFTEPDSFQKPGQRLAETVEDVHLLSGSRRELYLFHTINLTQATSYFNSATANFFAPIAI